MIKDITSYFMPKYSLSFLFFFLSAIVSHQRIGVMIDHYCMEIIKLNSDDLSN